jgi:hypothetical protein
MNQWGEHLYGAVHTAAEMLAIGLELPKTTFTDRTQYGPHLLAPTATDVEKYNELGTVYAGTFVFF